MTDKQIENLCKIKDLCCEKIKYCTKLCNSCDNPCNEEKILNLVLEVLNDR